MCSEIAQYLRQNPTEAEKCLWVRLRNRQLGDYRFRRQSPIGRYVVDFVCPMLKIIIEVDGGQHGTVRDNERTAWLEDEGYRVLRFWNHEVLANIEGVVETVRAALLDASGE
jgi:very-short-patch-repair endonuclease